MLSNESVPPAFSRSNSQASMDSTSMEDFWCEVESIKESREDGSEEAMLLEFKPADGEHLFLIAWLCLLPKVSCPDLLPRVTQSEQKY